MQTKHVYLEQGTLTKEVIAIFTFTMTTNNGESNKEKLIRLYNKYYEMTYKLVASKVSNPEIISDVVQDIWLKIWSTIDKAKEGSEKSWIVTLTCHIAINESIKDCNHRERFLAINDDYGTKSAFNDPADIVASNETVEYIYKEINNMDEIYSHILIMNLYFQCTPQEIVTLGNISLKTVYTRLSRGKAMLKEKLIGNKEVASWTGRDKKKETTK